MSTQVSVEIDERTEEAIEQLKKVFNVKSRAAAIRRAVAFARFAADEAADEHQVVTLKRKDGKERSIVLSG